MTFAEQILAFYFTLSKEPPLPKEVEVIYPFDNPQTKEMMEIFFNRYYTDTNPRTYLIGINPGRLGSV
jgi:hypothetical protein